MRMDAPGPSDADTVRGRQGTEVSTSPEEVLSSLLEVGVNLSVMPDRRKMLEMILTEARKLTRAEAGSLYLLRDDRLHFVAAQNNRLPLPEIIRVFLDKEMPASSDSLAGFVASTGRLMNIPDADRLGEDVPFHINRDFERASGYHTQSVLALPLKCPDGRCIGVLQLLNHIGPDGRVAPFPDAEDSGIPSLASMAAMTIENNLLQEQVKQAHLDTVIRLSVAAEFRDPETADHIRRVSRTCALIARAMDLSGHEAELIECASPMHDIGKIGIPDAILQKPGRLTPDERRIVEQHATIGAEILGPPQNELITVARDIALSHHERWDGRGYPRRLVGEQIPVAGRIVALADVFDALVSTRCYKRAYPPATALDIIRREDGKHFDPQVTAAFFQVVEDGLDAYGLPARYTTSGPLE